MTAPIGSLQSRPAVSKIDFSQKALPSFTGEIRCKSQHNRHRHCEPFSNTEKDNQHIKTNK